MTPLSFHQLQARKRASAQVGILRIIIHKLVFPPIKIRWQLATRDAFQNIFELWFCFRHLNQIFLFFQDVLKTMQRFSYRIRRRWQFFFSWTKYIRKATIAWDARFKHKWSSIFLYATIPWTKRKIEQNVLFVFGRKRKFFPMQDYVTLSTSAHCIHKFTLWSYSSNTTLCN